MSIFLQLFGLICLAFLLGLHSSRHILDVTILWLTAHRAGLKAYHEERLRVLGHDRLVTEAVAKTTATNVVAGP